MHTLSDNNPNAPIFPESAPDCLSDSANSKRELRDEEYRRRILAAARELFNKHGYDCVSMYQIAQTAGVGQGTLYRRYAHVGEVCSDMLKASTGQFLAELEASATVGIAGNSSLAQLDDVIVRIIEHIDGRAPLLSAINQQYAGQKRYLPYKQPIAMRLHKLMSSMLDRAIEQGEATHCDVTLTIHALVSVLAPENYLYYRESLGYDKERFIAGLRRLFIDNLRAQ